MLEKMAAFFEKRLAGYDEHMLTELEGAQEFYPFTAECLPSKPDAQILDLGCGTGLELEFYLRINPSAAVTGIDLSAGMLEALKRKFQHQNVTLIQGSYFDVPFESKVYDAAVSVESLHHFTQKQKTQLYRKLHSSLKDGGFFILTDYFAATESQEVFFFAEYERFKKESGIKDSAFYHYDTPLTVQHETESLLEAGFSTIEKLNNWGATHTLKAYK